MYTTIIKNTTNERFYGIVSYHFDKVRLFGNIGGAIIPIGIDGDVEFVIGDAYYGQIRFSKKGGIYLTNYEKVKSVKTGTNQHPGKGSLGQSKYQKIDAFLVNCKHSMYDAGLRAGTPAWDKGKKEAAELFVAAFGGDLHISKDTKKWFN